MTAFDAAATAATAAAPIANLGKSRRPSHHIATRSTASTNPSLGLRKSVSPAATPARSGRRIGAVTPKRYANPIAAAPKTFG